VAHATERQSVVASTAVLRYALERGTGHTDLRALTGELTRQVSEQQLIVKGEQYTTSEAQQREREILAMAARGQGTVQKIADQASIHRGLVGTPLNEGQRAAAELILSTSNRVVATQGAAGTGKTTMLKHAAALATANGLTLLGTAPSAAAARELAKAEMPTTTISAFLAKPLSLVDGKSLLVVDEAGMVSAKDMHALLQAVEGANARMVLVGDVQQLKAVEAGRPFAQLQEAGLARVEMAEIQRQTDARLQQAVELAYAGHVRQSVELLTRDTIEITNTEDRHARIAHDYAALGENDRAATLVVAGTRAAVASINAKVRDELVLAGKGVEINILSRKDLTRPQARSSLSYIPGDRVQALKSYPSLSLKSGEVTRVVDASPGKVTLARANGSLAVWRPAIETSMVVFKEETREMSVGDRVRVTANDHRIGLINGHQATVGAIDKNRQTMLLHMNGGQSLEVSYATPVHLDHAYCSTVHAAPGATATRVLIDADTTSVTSHEGMYYTAVSRAREFATLYTDDREESLPTAMGRPDSKHAALDLGPPTDRHNWNADRRTQPVHALQPTDVHKATTKPSDATLTKARAYDVPALTKTIITMQTEFMLLAIYNKPRLTLKEVCHAIGMSMKTAYNQRSARTFPIPMTGDPLMADIRDVAAYLDSLRQKSAQ
jgi:ATP-dependent exoDNAse (exonuclease V) alpha subunit